MSSWGVVLRALPPLNKLWANVDEIKLWANVDVLQTEGVK